MDQFFIEIYESIVYQWIVMNQNTYKKSGIHFHIDQNDPNKLVFISDELKGDIYFWTNHIRLVIYKKGVNDIDLFILIAFCKLNLMYFHVYLSILSIHYYCCLYRNLLHCWG